MSHTFDDDYWDAVWQGDRGASMAAADPNPHLVREIDHLEPGSALDAGCGAGAEAIWLAQRGWRVTGADITSEALVQAGRRAAEAGVAERVAWIQADLSVWEPADTYDLVATHYAHPVIPQLEFYDRVASWVAPGGTLFIVGHLHHDQGHHRDQGSHQHGGSDGHSDGPPDSASVTAASISERLDSRLWEVVTAEHSQRTTAHGDTTVTLHDVVVRAVRRP